MGIFVLLGSRWRHAREATSQTESTAIDTRTPTENADLASMAREIQSGILLRLAVKRVDLWVNVRPNGAPFA